MAFNDNSKSFRYADYHNDDPIWKQSLEENHLETLSINIIDISRIVLNAGFYHKLSAKSSLCEWLAYVSL